MLIEVFLRRVNAYSALQYSTPHRVDRANEHRASREHDGGIRHEEPFVIERFERIDDQIHKRCLGCGEHQVVGDADWFCDWEYALEMQ